MISIRPGSLDKTSSLFSKWYGGNVSEWLRNGEVHKIGRDPDMLAIKHPNRKETTTTQRSETEMKIYPRLTCTFGIINRETLCYQQARF